MLTGKLAQWHGGKGIKPVLTAASVQTYQRAVLHSLIFPHNFPEITIPSHHFLLQSFLNGRACFSMACRDPAFISL